MQSLVQGTKSHSCAAWPKADKTETKKPPNFLYIIWRNPVNPELWPPESHYFEEDVTFLPTVTTGIQSTLNRASYILMPRQPQTVQIQSQITNKTAIRIQRYSKSPFSFIMYFEFLIFLNNCLCTVFATQT